MDSFNGGSFGSSTPVIKFHSSSQWSPQFDGGSYGKSLHVPESYGRALSSQWKAPSERLEGVSYGKATRVIELVSLSEWKARFEASKQTQKLMVIYFTAAWCGPCKALEPAINEMAAKFADVDFIKIDVDKLVSVSIQYGVQTMPTFILMKNGKQVDTVTGVKKEELQTKVLKHKAQIYYS